MRRPTRDQTIAITALGGLLALAVVGGCDEGVETEAPPAPQPAVMPVRAENAPSAPTAGGMGGSSSLGAAKRSAKNVASQVEERQQELLRQMKADDNN